MISFSPSEDQQMMINLVKQFAADEMRKICRQCDEKGQIPHEIIDTAWEWDPSPRAFRPSRAG